MGKIAMGLRVVSDNGGPERFRQALFRALASLVEIWMLAGSPAVICSILSPKAKRIGDFSPAPSSSANAVLGWRRRRRCRRRWPGGRRRCNCRAWTPAGPRSAPIPFSCNTTRSTHCANGIAYRIAGDVVSRIAPLPPPGAPPELVLAAVLAERRRRELARLDRCPLSMAANPTGTLAARGPRRRAVTFSASAATTVPRQDSGPTREAGGFAAPQ